MGSISVKAEYAGREDEILMKIYNDVTLFFYPLPVDFQTGSFNSKILDGSYGKWSPKLTDASLVNWYWTIMMTPDGMLDAVLMMRCCLYDQMLPC